LGSEADLHEYAPADRSPMRIRDGGDVIGREADIYWGCAAER
jgi:hypothetical protein